MSIDVSPVDATLGAVVRGVTLSGDLEQSMIDEIVAAWHEHAVLIFPEQYFDDARQAAFSRRLGPLENVAIFQPGAEDGINGRSEEFAQPRQMFSYLTNEARDGSLVAHDSKRNLLLKGNSYWHSDSSYKSVPAKGSLLAARAVPDTGGETEWADMRAAYDALAPDMKEWLQDKYAVHSYSYSQGLVGGADLIHEEVLPPVEHPIIRPHSVTGRNILYVGRHTSHIVGEDVEESRELLRKLCDEACQPPRTWKHRWSEGDAVLWDNRAVLHRGHAYPAHQLRRMVRTTLAGDGEHEWLYDAGMPANLAT